MLSPGSRLFRLIFEHDIDAQGEIIACLFCRVALQIDIPYLPPPAKHSVFIDVERFLVHNGRGGGIAFRLEDMAVAFLLYGIEGMLLDHGEGEGLPTVEGGEILAEEDLVVVSGRGKCGDKESHHADECEKIHGPSPIAIRRWIRCRWTHGLPCSRSSGRRSRSCGGRGRRSRNH